mmetsp:Transcript_5270/g.7659  ORF Transcript_5270/g.7659 Transcript_5270/m.7659 type:complete len:90 (-) Transcript_5270:390-659(-)
MKCCMRKLIPVSGDITKYLNFIHIFLNHATLALAYEAILVLLVVLHLTQVAHPSSAKIFRLDRLSLQIMNSLKQHVPGLKMIRDHEMPH